MPSFKEIKEGLFRYEEADKGWVALVKDARTLLKAAEKVRDAGVKSFDCFSPFPIHGLEKAMGLPRSWVPFITLLFGLLGASFGFLAMTYIANVDWPIVYGGKPFFAWPSYIPVTFELTILLGGLATVGSVIYLGRLTNVNRKPVHPSVTQDGFAIWIGDDMSKDQVDKIVGDLAQEVFAISKDGGQA